jgi:O-antigen/teichoic acid export membrane protein
MQPPAQPDHSGKDPAGEGHVPESLTSATVHGLKWSYTSSAVNVVLQIGVTAVLARLLTPSAFGLVAMAGVFISFGRYFAQMGAGQALVQKAELSAGDVRTAFTASLLMGLAFCGLFVALAPLAAVLFPHTPGVVMVARVMSLTFVIGGLTASTQGLLQRRFAFRAIALTEIGSYLLGYALVGLILAVSGFGAWSLVAASLSAGALAAVAFTLLCRREIGFGLSAHSFRAIYWFGGRVSLIGFGEFIGSSLDTLWAGHYLGSQATGLYSRATNIANLPLYYFTTSLSRVLLPGYSRIQFERERLKTVYLATITVFGALVMPVAWGVAGAAHEVVVTLLGDQWIGAVPVLVVLALAVPFTVLTQFGASMCEATANLNMKIAITVARIVLLAALLVMLGRLGIIGIAAAFALSELATHVAYTLAMRRLLALDLADLLRAYSVGLVAGVVTGLALFGLHAGLTGLGWPAAIILLVQVTLGGLILLVSTTRAYGGLVWREIRLRLADAGHLPGDPGLAAWLIRRMDALT